MSGIHELTVVMPVHNEAEILGDVVREWTHHLEALQIDYLFHAYDDGSTDRSLEVLGELARKHPRLHIASHRNRGHGPTLLRGYVEACGEWILQIDSDGETDPADFEEMWRKRAQQDFVLGVRRHRDAPATRRLVSLLAAWTVRWAFGATLRDVNAPFRLMRRSVVMDLLQYVPHEAFAPNVALSGLAAAEGLRIHELPVRSRPRSRPGGGYFWLLRGVSRALRETLTTAARYLRGRGVGRAPTVPRP